MLFLTLIGKASLICGPRLPAHVHFDIEFRRFCQDFLPDSLTHRDSLLRPLLVRPILDFARDKYFVYSSRPLRRFDISDYGLNRLHKAVNWNEARDIHRLHEDSVAVQLGLLPPATRTGERACEEAPQRDSEPYPLWPTMPPN